MKYFNRYFISLIFLSFSFLLITSSLSNWYKYKNSDSLLLNTNFDFREYDYFADIFFQSNDSLINDNNKNIYDPSKTTFFYKVPRAEYVKKFTQPITTINSNNTTLNLQEISNNLRLINKINQNKEKFIISILPLIIDENQKIINKKIKLEEIKQFLTSYKTLNINDQNFLNRMAREYNVVTLQKHKIDIIYELIKKVDVIPNSIVIAQAANESGWGSSRFAKEYNALFGEYTYDINKGVVPRLREEGKNHLIKFFPTVNDSIQSYFRNINTHFAYGKFRERRKFFRDRGLNLDPDILINDLTNYAEDKNYIKRLKSILHDNQLYKLDNIIKIKAKS